MARRITITIDPDVETRLRNLQAKKIVESRRTVSFSQILNQILADGLDHNGLE